MEIFSPVLSLGLCPNDDSRYCEYRPGVQMKLSEFKVGEWARLGTWSRNVFVRILAHGERMTFVRANESGKEYVLYNDRDIWQPWCKYGEEK